MMTTLLVAGCAKENLVESMGPQNRVTILTAGTPSTKTVLQNDQKVLWTNGDVINVNGVESEALVLDTPAATATFTIPGVLNNPFKAVFPASIYKDAQTVNLPAVQAYAEGSFGPNVSPMAAYQANGNNLNFKHLCAVLKLNIEKGEDADDIMYVEFSGKNEEQVCGDFSINFEDATLEGASTAASAKKVRCNVYEEISSEGLAVYVAVPAVEYQSGYTVKVVDTKGHFMEISKQSGETLVAGKIYDMPAFTFVPTGTEFNVGITSAAEFNDVVAKYNAGTYEANTVAAILNDIEFSASDCSGFNPINSFAGTLKGNHYTISGFNTGRPIVDKTTADAVIENLTVSGEATVVTLTYTNNAFGTFAASNNGVIQNCHSAVNYTVDSNTATFSGRARVGALVGENTGTISECVNTGNLDLATNYKLGSELDLGGITGYNNGASSRVENSELKGRIQLLCNANGKSINVGGVVGYNTSGTVSNCRTYAISDETRKAAAGDYRATFIYSSTGVGTFNASGIAGRNEGIVESCSNGADIISSGSGTHLRLTGIVSVNTGTIRSVVNSAPISSYSAFTTQNWLAGVCAEQAGNIIDCKNEGDILIGGASKVNVNNMIGGVIAYQYKNKTITPPIINEGNVIVETVNPSNAGMWVRLGGCFGLSLANIEGDDQVKNYGEVKWNSTDGWTTTTNLANPHAIGGVVGQIEGNISRCINHGNVSFNESAANAKGGHCYIGGVAGFIKSSQISQCDNYGKVNFNVTAASGDGGNTRIYQNIALGGIAGRNYNQKITIEDCDNHGNVEGGLNTYRNNTATCHYGGIIGYLNGGSSSITQCNVTSALINRTYNNSYDNFSQAVFSGGIAGYVAGANNAEISISDCNVKAEDGGAVKLQALRGRLGGVAGYALYVNISNIDCNLLSDYGHQCFGGICGDLENSTASNCTINATHNSSFCHYAAGFVGEWKGKTVVENCTFRGALDYTDGADGNHELGLLVGRVSSATDSGSEIKNCKYLGTILGEPTEKLIGRYINENSLTLTNNTQLSE